MTNDQNQRWLKSPFNGQVWPVPADVNDAMYAALLKAGFTEMAPKKEKRAGPERAA